MEPPPQPKRGEGSHESHLPVPDGGFPEKSGGGSNGDWGVSGACHRRGGPLWSVRHNEMVVSARVRTGTQLLMGGYGKGRGGISRPYIRGRNHTPLACPGLPTSNRPS